MNNKFYLLYIKSNTVDVKWSRREIKCQLSKKYYLSFELYFYANDFYLSLYREHSKK